MRLKIVRKDELSVEQAEYLKHRLSAAEHNRDGAIIEGWHHFTQSLYAFVHIELLLPIGIGDASGRPAPVPAWWIDSRYRGQGYGNELVDLLADHLKREGVTRIGPTRIASHDGKYDVQSCKLLKRLLRHFGQATGDAS